MRIQRFEDLPVWQEGREILRDIYAITGKQSFKDFSLKDQMRRAAVSFISNVAEGFERSSNREFINFLYIAKGSLGELRSQLYVALDCGYLYKEDFEPLFDRSLSISRQTNNFIKYLKQSDVTKSRHKER